MMINKVTCPACQVVCESPTALDEHLAFEHDLPLPPTESGIVDHFIEAAHARTVKVIVPDKPRPDDWWIRVAFEVPSLVETAEAVTMHADARLMPDGIWYLAPVGTPLEPAKAWLRTGLTLAEWGPGIEDGWTAVGTVPVESVLNFEPEVPVSQGTDVTDVLSTLADAMDALAAEVENVATRQSKANTALATMLAAEADRTEIHPRVRRAYELARELLTATAAVSLLGRTATEPPRRKDLATLADDILFSHERAVAADTGRDTAVLDAAEARHRARTYHGTSATSTYRPPGVTMTTRSTPMKGHTP